MIKAFAFLAVTLAALVPGCEDKQVAAPPPQEVTGEAVAQFCNMLLGEHPGPKGQVFLKSEPTPLWFASARDVFAFVMLPDTPKAVVAIYVNDMAKVKNWDQPEPGTWIDARKALYVIGSRKRSGMGEEEAVPFSDRAAAERFAAENGGRIVDFDDMPRDYILTEGGAPAARPVR